MFSQDQDPEMLAWAGKTNPPAASHTEEDVVRDALYRRSSRLEAVPLPIKTWMQISGPALIRPDHLVPPGYLPGPDTSHPRAA
jgi:hypothetical protein